MANPTRSTLQRRLAAILVLDVVGYSSLMEKDEEGTLAQIEDLREAIHAFVDAHTGRIFKTAGDGLFAEFSSPVEAVRCAMEVQAKLSEEASVHPTNALRLRIGINLGDIIVEKDGDVYGDGVNVAARLEQLAEPGGICISGAVFDQIEGKVDGAFENRGEQQVKNITRPVRVYTFARLSPRKAISTRTALPLPERPSIAVLPFTNMSGDPEQEYFADGVAEEVITALSRIRWLFVIARNSSFTYKGKAADVRQVGRELGVRYVLEGSIRRGGDRIRTTGQLVEAASGRHLWADRFDSSLGDIFELQDRITQEVIAAVEPNIRTAEINRAQRKPTESLDAYDLYLRALPELHSYTEPGFKRARYLLEEAVLRDENYADAWGALADCIGRIIVAGWSDDLELSRGQVRVAAEKAVKTGADNGWSLANAAWAQAAILTNIDKAVELANEALRLQPNSAHVLMQCGWVVLLGGEIDRARLLFETARRISPLDPRSYTIVLGIGAAHYYSRRFSDAVHWAQRAVEQGPSFAPALRYLAASLAQSGHIEEARETVDRLLKVTPSASLTRTRISASRHPEMLELYIDGLRKAGLPE